MICNREFPKGNPCYYTLLQTGTKPINFVYLSYNGCGNGLVNIQWAQKPLQCLEISDWGGGVAPGDMGIMLSAGGVK